MLLTSSKSILKSCRIHITTSVYVSTHDNSDMTWTENCIFILESCFYIILNIHREVKRLKEVKQWPTQSKQSWSLKENMSFLIHHGFKHCSLLCLVFRGDAVNLTLDSDISERQCDWQVLPAKAKGSKEKNKRGNEKGKTDDGGHGDQKGNYPS